jgi:hypothetical protein
MWGTVGHELIHQHLQNTILYEWKVLQKCSDVYGKLNKLTAESLALLVTKTSLSL